jgi:hypothetical protein
MWLSKQGSPAENPITGQVTLTPEQAQQFAGGEWYINVHTQAHPGGEIRGYVMPPRIDRGHRQPTRAVTQARMGLASVAVVRSPATFSGQPMSFVNDRLCRFATV